jgi:hypothetical protein
VAGIGNESACRCLMIAGRAALDLLKDQLRLFDSGINAVNGLGTGISVSGNA